jgi:hypothetical protein
MTTKLKVMNVLWVLVSMLHFTNCYAGGQYTNGQQLINKKMGKNKPMAMTDVVTERFMNNAIGNRRDGLKDSHWDLYSINYPKDSTGIMKIKVDTSGNVELVSFPDTKGTIKVTNLNAPVFGKITAGASITPKQCETVANEAKVAKTFPTYYEIIRLKPTINASIDSQYNMAELSTYIKDTLRDKYSRNFANINILNPISIENLNIGVDLKSNAISNYIGDIETMLESINKGININDLQPDGRIAINNANFPADLLCDVYFNKATLNLNLSGNYAESQSQKILLTDDEISGIYNNLVKKDSEHITYGDSRDGRGSSQGELIVCNFALSSLQLKTELNIINKKISPDDFIAIFEAIIDPKSGRIVLGLALDELHKRMQVTEPSQSKFNANSDLRLSFDLSN